jgi:hypothetical protein
MGGLIFLLVMVVVMLYPLFRKNDNDGFLL